jgi:alkanesulfonate monooxygenase SsuD/methylene tetrahydromethanopterin reductase-like flavin-dependent oxidoreductase (luciferase family)
MGKISIRNAKTAKPGLYDLIKHYETETGKSFKDVVMVEVGCYVGDSTEIWAQNCKEIHAVDPWLNGYDDTDPSSYNIPMKTIEAQFDELLPQYPNIIKHKMKSVDAAALFDDESLDFVYIDGDHRYEAVKDDIDAWLPKVKKGLIIAGHDYQHKWAPGVKPAVLEKLGSIDRHFQDTSWCKKI